MRMGEAQTIFKPHHRSLGWLRREVSYGKPKQESRSNTIGSPRQPV